jgi:hypothetical protein
MRYQPVLYAKDKPAFLVLVCRYWFHVGGVHAIANSAQVVDDKARRYCALGQFISNAMRPFILSVPIKLTVPILVHGSSP